MRSSILILGCIAMLMSYLHAETQILEINPELRPLIPKEAWEGPGAWVNDSWFIATGQSISIDSLGVAKGRNTEKEFAEYDARNRLVRLAASERNEAFDPEMFDIVSNLKGVRIATTYYHVGRDPLFLVVMTKKSDVQVNLVFAPDRARRYAHNLFNVGEWHCAAKALAVLNAHGAEDAETMSLARVASAHVNLDAGVAGDSKITDLKTLAVFYENRKQWEVCMKYNYQIYQLSDNPERSALEKLIKLAKVTRRFNNVTAFEKEILRRWPPPESPPKH